MSCTECSDDHLAADDDCSLADVPTSVVPQDPQPAPDADDWDAAGAPLPEDFDPTGDDYLSALNRHFAPASAAPGTVAHLLEIAGNEVGYHEGVNNDNKYAAIAGFPNHQPWCDTFIVATAKLAGVAGIPHFAYCPSSEAAYKAAGRLHSTPQVGDQFFVYIRSEGTVGHTGWVTGMAAGGRSVYTIEGNSNASGSPEGIEVVRRVRPVLRTAPNSGIRSYGRPQYVPGGVTPPKPKPPTPAYSISVKALQKAVHVSADGAWGRTTSNAVGIVRSAAMSGMRGWGRDNVRTLQTAVGTPRDGIVGPLTRAALNKTVRTLQVVLNVAPDGDWGPITEAAFARAKAKYARL